MFHSSPQQLRTDPEESTKMGELSSAAFLSCPLVANYEMT